MLRFPIVSMSLIALLPQTAVRSEPVSQNQSVPSTIRDNRCPALDAHDQPFPIGAPHRHVLAANAGLPAADISRIAQKIVGQFEGDGESYSTVSSRDTISIGISQWNVTAGTLFHTFLAAVGPAELKEASPRLVADLASLKASRSGSDSRAKAVLTRWTNAAAGEPLVNGINARVRSDLEAWLNRPGMRQVQDKLIQDSMQLAYNYAAAWQKDRSSHNSAAPVDARELTYFDDMVTFSGGNGGVWIEHVRAYRRQFPKASDALSDMSHWIDACVTAKNHGRKLYAVRDAQRNLAYWQKLASDAPARFDDATMDLVVFAFLRARQAKGDDHPHGQPGVYQPSVFYRRALTAIGSGWFSGEAATVKPRDIYAWASKH